jgi:hypothetical protein
MMGWTLVTICTLEVVAAALNKQRVQPIVHVESSKSLLRRMAKRSQVLSLPPKSARLALTKVWSSTATSWVATKTSPIVVEHVVVPSNMSLLTIASHGGDPALEHVDVQRVMVGGGR